VIVHSRGLTSRATRWLLPAAAIAMGGCEDTLPPPRCESEVLLCVRSELTAAIVSDPAPYVAVAPSAVSRDRAPGEVAHVSLPPGLLPDAEQVTIRNPRTGTTRTVPMQDGGFDPVVVDASANDILELDIRTASGAMLGFMVTVPPSRRPIVVRTDPPPRKRDVPLNAMMLVVFSEPIDPATVSPSSVVLSLGGAPVAGTLAFGDSSHLTVTFTPADSLVGGAEYALLVTQGIADRQGESLEAPVTVEFWSEPPWALIVSDPAGGTVYASLPPWNSYGERVVIQNRSTGAQVVAEMVDGGLDPTPLAAAAGDTLDFRMDLTVSDVAFEFFAVVPLGGPPQVVRTDPPPGRRDVAPDAVPLVVFSEPIDAAVLTDSSVQLTLDGAPVAGTFAFGDGAQLRVMFTPAEPLAIGAEYALLVTQAVGDLDGDTLDEPVTVGFATGGPPLPPGTQLAFVRDGQVHVVNSDGTGVIRLSDGPDDADPAWSPDGQRIAFASARGAPPESTAIYIMDAGGTNLVRRTTAPFAQAPSWSPDGQWIVFAAYPPDWTPGSAGSMDILVTRAEDDGTSPIRLTDIPGFEIQPAWSPDGARIAFVSDSVAYDFTADIFTMAPDGSQHSQLTDGFGFGESLVQYYQPTWSPDGQRLAVVTCRIGFETCSASTVSVMNADGSGLVALAATIGWDGATWSPDGQTIAFGSAGSLYWVSADGSALGVVVVNGHSPAWRP
jgi:hypothetical protein